MSGDEKSTDPGLSAAERRALRGREAKEAIADHEEAQRAFHGNRERLREERLAREAAAGQCSILHQSCRTIRPSKTSDFLRGSRTR